MSNPITEQAVADAVTAALAAIDAARDSADLKAARAAHAGETSPLAQLNGAIRELPGDQKAAAGKLVGQARGQVTQALAAAEERILVAEEQARLAA
ncbi:phenylalanine--tRNA ligase subunit alpha, partial [Schumannella luteola]